MVNAYLLRLGSRWQDFHNLEGRAFPDVSAQAVNYLVIDKGYRRYIHGTSASAPVSAAQIVLVNAARIQEGIQQVGFWYPSLYRKGK